MAYSTHFRERTASLSGEAPVVLLEITHPQLLVPARVVNDTADLVSNGNLFVACGFSVTLPDDFDKQLPRAQLAIDNVGRELTQWLEASNGGRGAQVRLMQVMRDTPDVLECDLLLDLKNVKQTTTQITASLGYDDTLGTPGLAARYDPATTPGLF